jgi:hypothetical protein
MAAELVPTVEGVIMKRVLFLAALALALAPASVLAMCYTVLGPNSVVVWRGSNTPIDLSKPVSVGMRSVFPAGTYLVISDETTGCTPVGPQNFFGPMDFSRPPVGMGPGQAMR